MACHPHIAQVICGHKTIDTTMGYKAVYPAEAIEAHRAFIARRRATGPAKNAALRPTKNGTPSSPTSRSEKSPSGPAPERLERPASMNTRVSDARSYGRTRPNAPAWKRSATTSKPALSRRNEKAGSVRSRDSKSATAASKTNSPKSTQHSNLAPARSNLACPPSPRSPAERQHHDSESTTNDVPRRARHEDQPRTRLHRISRRTVMSMTACGPSELTTQKSCR
jgi:hypothetical protein